MTTRRHTKTILAEYSEARAIADNISSQYKEAVKVSEALKEELHEAMRRDELATLKMSDGTLITRAKYPTFRVLDKRALEDWFDNNPDVEKDAYWSLEVNTAMAKTLAKNFMTRTGEILPGFEYTEGERLALRAPKE